jgi:hypothetical protein
VSVRTRRLDIWAQSDLSGNSPEVRQLQSWRVLGIARHEMSTWTENNPTVAKLDLTHLENRYDDIDLPSRSNTLANSVRAMNRTCLLPPGREIPQEFLGSLIEPFLIFLLSVAGFNRVLGSTDPNQFLCSRVIHTKHECPDING